MTFTSTCRSHGCYLRDVPLPLDRPSRPPPSLFHRRWEVVRPRASGPHPAGVGTGRRLFRLYAADWGNDAILHGLPAHGVERPQRLNAGAVSEISRRVLLRATRHVVGLAHQLPRRIGIGRVINPLPNRVELRQLLGEQAAAPRHKRSFLR